MHIAIQSVLVLFLIAFPGVIFRRFFFQGEFSKQFDSKGWSHSLFLSLVLGVLIHSFLIGVYYYSNFLIDFVNVKKIYNFFNYACDFNLNTLRIELAFWYLGLLYFIPSFWGLSLYFFIRYTKLDVKLPIFRFQNYWHYYFSGEILKYHQFKIPQNKTVRKGRIMLTFIDVLYKEKENVNTLLSGILSQYTINKNTWDIDYLYISETTKYIDFNTIDYKIFNKQIQGDFIVIPREKIININVRFLREPFVRKSYVKLYRTILFISNSFKLL